MAKFKLEVNKKEVQHLNDAAKFLGVSIDDDVDSLGGEMIISGNAKKPEDLFKLGKMTERLKTLPEQKA